MTPVLGLWLVVLFRKAVNLEGFARGGASLRAGFLKFYSLPYFLFSLFFLCVDTCDYPASQLPSQPRALAAVPSLP